MRRRLPPSDLLWLAVLSLLCATFLISQRSDSRLAKAYADAKRQEAERAGTTAELSRGYRAIPHFKSGCLRHLIGDLAYSPSSDELLLTASQSDALIKLDRLGEKSDDLAATMTADYLDTNPGDYTEYLRRNQLRREFALGAAQQMVSLGLLTASQANLVVHRYVSRVDARYTLGNAVIQRRLGFTDEQRARLARVWEDSRAARQNTMSQEALKLLTAEQMQMWSQLRATKALPAEPPQLPSVIDVAMVYREIEKLSPALGVLFDEENTATPWGEQRMLLKDLHEVTCLGWVWIGSQSENVDETRAEFVEQAEIVALTGILSEEQAKKYGR
jgi:hypothetical protein